MLTQIFELLPVLQSVPRICEDENQWDVPQLECCSRSLNLISTFLLCVLILIAVGLWKIHAILILSFDKKKLPKSFRIVWYHVPWGLNCECYDGTKNKMKGLLQLQSKKRRRMYSLGFGTIVYFFYLLNSVSLIWSTNITYRRFPLNMIIHILQDLHHQASPLRSMFTWLDNQAKNIVRVRHVFVVFLRYCRLYTSTILYFSTFLYHP